MRFRLVEDIDAVRRNFPKISEKDFDRLIRLDPTFKEGRDSVGTYGKWILTLFNKGKLTDENHVKDVLTAFEEEKNNLINRDIGRFKSIEEVDAYLNDEDSYKVLTRRQELRKVQKAVRNTDLEKDAEKIFENSSYVVWVPKTYEASCRLGQGSSWCTASTESDRYYNMYTRDGDLYIIINKSNNDEKYQFHFESKSFMDKDDSSINLVEFINLFDKELVEFFRPKFMEKVLNLPIETRFNDDVKVTFNSKELERVLDNVEKGNTTIGSENLYTALTDPFELVSEWYYESYELVHNQEHIEYLIRDLDDVSLNKLKDYLESSDIDIEFVMNDIDLKNAFALAYETACQYGDAEYLQNLIIQKLEDCASDYNGQYDAVNTALNCAVSVYEILSDINSGYYSGDIDLFDDGAKNLVANQIMVDFRIRDHEINDVQSFDGEVFNSSFRDELANI